MAKDIYRSTMVGSLRKLILDSFDSPRQPRIPFRCLAAKKPANNSKKETATSPFSHISHSDLSTNRNTNSISNSGKNSSNSSEYQNPRDPPRITSNVSANLKLVKYLKETQKVQRPAQANSYRKKKSDKLKDDDFDAVNGTNSWGLDSYFHGTHWPSADDARGPPTLIVDGYNVCGYWPKLKRNFQRGQLEAARLDLLEELATFGAVKGVRVICVFDSHLSGRPTHKEQFQGVDVVFSDELADQYIEKEVAILKQNLCPRVWVATSDNAEADYAWAKGAFVWSCSLLVREIKAAKRALQKSMDEINPNRYSFQGKLLEHNLDNDTKNALYDLRKELIKAQKYP